MTIAASADRAYLVCPLCGFEFNEDDTLCEHGCPFRAGCPLSRCPSCGYEFAEQPRVVTWWGWLRGLLGRRPAEAACERPLSVVSLRHGETGRVSSLPGSERRRNTLAVFGLVPGSEVTLVQSSPAYVVRIGETELALDAEIAAEILLQPSEPA